jgi:thiamine biosynthesis protein ThiI
MKGLLLISGGIDSPVAGAVMQKKNVEVDALHFSYAPFTGDEPEHKSKDVAKLLGFKKFIVVNISKAVEELSKKTRHKYYFILSKRFMMKLAERLAKKLKYDFLITGESLAQVSSQTLVNLNSIDKAVDIKIIRPLFGWDKQEIINEAKKLGTFEISKGPEVCDVLAAKKPATKAEYSKVLNEESKINTEKLLKDCLKQIT